MYKRKNQMISLVLAFLFFLLSVCYFDISSDHFFGLSLQTDSNCCIRASADTLIDGTLCTTEMLKLRDETEFQLSNQAMNLKRICRENKEYFYNQHIDLLSFLEGRLSDENVASSVCVLSQPEQVLQYIHETDGKKQI